MMSKNVRGKLELRFEIKKFKEADIRRLSEIYLEWTINTPFKDDSRTIETVETQFTQLAQNENEFVILAYGNSDNLVGWTNFFVGFPEMIFTGRWHPIVLLGDDESDIALALIKEYKRYGVEIGRIRLESQFNRITESHQQLFEKYSKWYESQGFYRVTEEGFMELDVSEKHSLHVEIPVGFDLVPIEKKTNEEIKEVFFETFLGGKDGLFLDLSYDQQVESFNYWFDREKEFTDGASLLLLKDGEVAGFLITRPHHSNAMIGPVGVNPKYQRKGLGKTLIASAINSARENGIEKIQLEMDTSNTPAYRLYKSFGFKTLHKAVFYAWIPEGGKSDE